MSQTLKFGTDGWRAVMAKDFTFANVAVVAQAIADMLIKKGTASKGVFIGYDARLLSDLFARTVAEVLSANGIPALLPDRDTPTPVTDYTIKARDLAGAVMLTASHNPAQYNGIKFLPDTLHPALPDITDVIEQNISKLLMQPSLVKSDVNDALIQMIDPLPDYFEALHKLIDTSALKGLKVVFDPLYATGRGYVDRFLREVGADVVTIKGDWNPGFGGKMPDPNTANTRDLAAKVLELGAAIGLSNDGDADRFGIVDDDGTWLSPNKIIVLTMNYLIQKRKPVSGDVIRTVATTHQIDALAKAHGAIKVTETPVGFKWVGSEMAHLNALVGGEESGGLSIMDHIPEKDGIMADILMAEMVAATGKSCGQHLKEIEAITGEFVSGRIDIHIDEAKKNIMMSELKQNPPSHFAGQDVVKTDTRDGVKLWLADGSWALIRASGTEPMVRAYAEGNSAQRLAEVQQAIRTELG
ncbi:MAG: phosphoglucomutase/phosphomannomutase family protein [Armatimonadota bacterium]